MRICFFGGYNPNYSRNKILIQGLILNGVEIIECRTELRGIIKYFDLIKKHWKIRKQYDVLLVAFPGWHAVVLAKFLTRKPIIFDAFVSVYDSTVFDRKNTKKRSLKAKYFWLMDWLACKLADKVLLDTNEHIKYFVEEFGLNEGKFVRISVGADDSVLRPIKVEDKRRKSKFIVHYHGNVIPLQGVKYILESAKLLKLYKDIQFNLIGSRVKRWYEKSFSGNVNFIENVPYEKLAEYISQADICLGIFGDTNKTQRVIPNKVYEYMACQKPIITADTPAIRELFNENDLHLIPTASPEVLAKAILKLKNDSALREKLAENAYNRFIQIATPKILAGELIKIINKSR